VKGKVISGNINRGECSTLKCEFPEYAYAGVRHFQGRIVEAMTFEYIFDISCRWFKVPFLCSISH